MIANLSLSFLLAQSKKKAKQNINHDYLQQLGALV